MARHQNLLVSQEENGPLRESSIHDCIALCELVISPESTVVLDALYMDCNVVIWDTQKLIFAELPHIDRMSDVIPFVRNPAASKLACDAVRSRYGDINYNLTRAAGYIESLIKARG